MHFYYVGNAVLEDLHVKGDALVGVSHHVGWKYFMNMHWCWVFQKWPAMLCGHNFLMILLHVSTFQWQFTKGESR